MQTSNLYSGDDLECHRATTVALLRLAALARAGRLHGYATVYLDDAFWQVKHWARAISRRRRHCEQLARPPFPS
jgi:hypothetical protein